MSHYFLPSIKNRISSPMRLIRSRSKLTINSHRYLLIDETAKLSASTLMLPKLSQYRFEIRHIIALFVVLISFPDHSRPVPKSLLGGFLTETQNWFPEILCGEAGRSSLDKHVENCSSRTTSGSAHSTKRSTRARLYSLNVIIKQQLIQRSVEDICLNPHKEQPLYVVDNGQKLYSYFTNHPPAI